MTSDVVEMTKGSTIFCWLCRECQASRIADGWSVKRRNVAWGCDDHERARQRAEDYKTPTPDYVPTAPESFCPPPGWVAPAVPETWAARLAGKKKEVSR